MVDEQLARRDITDSAVLDAMRRVPRHEFAPEASLADAYGDHPLRIGHGATISQPYIVALMTQALQISPGDRVLEIGTGSGYGAAVLAELAAEVVSVERVAVLARTAAERLRRYDHVRVVIGDGAEAGTVEGFFDAVSVTAATPEIPAALVTLLRVGGRLVVPVGTDVADLVRLTREAGGDDRRETVSKVRFVPLRRGVVS